MPGLSPLPYYTPADAKLIAEKKGKPYARLAVTAELADWALILSISPTFKANHADAARAIQSLAATGSETKEVE